MQIDEDTDTYSLHLEFVWRGGFLKPRTKARLSKIVTELLTEIHSDTDDANTKEANNA